MDATSVNAFKGRLERRGRHQMDFFKDVQRTSPISCTTTDLSTFDDDFRTTKVGAAAPGMLPGMFRGRNVLGAKRPLIRQGG